ncbi:MAG: UMP kinase, partial [Ignavibacteria bacterium]|nr:UMP kinase [Ignavibacteria bacterium]
VDGVYDADPEKNKDAVMYENITFGDALSKNLKVMDMTAFALCRENNIPIIVFNMNKENNFEDIVLGKKVGTFVHN